MTGMSKISFIIASVDRDKELLECIRSIEKAHEFKPEAPIDIIVVIQNEGQKKDIQFLYPELTKIFYIKTKGLSVARNFALGKTDGDYYVFIDDDAKIDQDFIAVLSEKIAKYPEINAFCGKLIDHFQKIPFSRLFVDNKPRNLGRLDFQFFMGSGHVLTRNIIKRIGGYDERFGVGAKYHGSEETDIFFRLLAAGERILYLPDLVFFHPIPDTPATYVQNYAYGFAAMLTKSFINDKRNFLAYFLIFFQRTIKASIRILQKMLFGGVYAEKDRKYHYGSLLKGTFKGIKDYITTES